MSETSVTAPAVDTPALAAPVEQLAPPMPGLPPLGHQEPVAPAPQATVAPHGQPTLREGLGIVDKVRIGDLSINPTQGVASFGIEEYRETSLGDVPTKTGPNPRRLGIHGDSFMALLDVKPTGDQTAVEAIFAHVQEKFDVALDQPMQVIEQKGQPG
jgi:hypothetical protein